MTKKQTFINPLGRSLVGFLTKEKVAKLTYKRREFERSKYEDLARKLNIFQASLIGLSTGTKPNLESITGVNQEAFLSTSVINDILTLNNTIERILECLRENEAYSKKTGKLEIHLSVLARQLEFLNEELAKDAHNIDEKEAERTAAKKDKDKIKKKEKLQKIATEFSALLEKKSRVLDGINSVEHDQNETKNTLNQINGLIEHNETILKGLFSTFERIWGSYSKEFLKSISKDENPFNVEIDQEGLTRVLEQK